MLVLPSQNGYTPLHVASQEGHEEMVRLLLEHGAGADSSAANGLRPLHLAAQEDHVQVADALVVASGGQVDPQTKVRGHLFNVCIYLSIYLSIYLFILSIYLSIYLSI